MERARPKRHADPDLAISLRHCLRKQTVRPDAGEQRRQCPEEGSQAASSRSAAILSSTCAESVCDSRKLSDGSIDFSALSTAGKIISGRIFVRTFRTNAPETEPMP